MEMDKNITNKRMNRKIEMLYKYITQESFRIICALCSMN